MALLHLNEISATVSAQSLPETPLRGRIGLQAGIQAAILLAAGGWWLLRPRYGTAGLLLLTCLDLVVAARLNLPATVADMAEAAPTNAALQALSGAFPLPVCDRPIGQLNEGNLQGSIPPLYANMGTLHRLPGSDGGSPYTLKIADSARQNHDLERVLALPLASVAGTQAVVWPLSATPNRFAFKVANNPAGGSFVFAQHAYPGWQASVDGQQVPISRFATAYQAIALPPGDHLVVFHFNPGWLFPFLWISLFAWILVLGWICWEKIWPLPVGQRLIWIATVGLMVGSGAAIAAREYAARVREKRFQPAAFANPNLFTGWITARPQMPGSNGFWLPAVLRSDIPRLIAETDQQLPSSIQLVQDGPTFAIERDLLLATRPFISRETRHNGYTVRVLHRRQVPGSREAARLLGFCSYDSASTNWQPAPVRLPDAGYLLSQGQRLQPEGFSPGLDQPIESLLSPLVGGRLVLSAKAKPASGPGPTLVISIKRGDSTLHWFGLAANAALPIPDSSGWYHGHLSVAVPGDLRPGDRLQGYLWNNTPYPSDVDEIRLLWVKK